MATHAQHSQSWYDEHGQPRPVGTASGRKHETQNPKIAVQPGEAGDLTGRLHTRLVDDATDVEMTLVVRTWPRTALGLEQLENLLTSLRRRFDVEVSYARQSLGRQADDDIPF